jgi:uncharacterized OB-fold protein
MSNVETTFSNSRVEKTYKMVEKDGIMGIKCLVCNMTSYFPMDIEKKYCENCKRFHNEISHK